MIAVHVLQPGAAGVGQRELSAADIRGTYGPSVCFVLYLVRDGKMAEDRRLGAQQVAALSGGRRLAYRETGRGTPVVFVHGLLANGDLWRDVVPPVARAGCRCVTVDLPLGSHQFPMPDGSDLTPPGLASLVSELLEALDLENAFVVANDTGGAIVQIMMATNPRRVAGVVLTSSDGFERFFPPVFRFVQWLGYVPGGAWLVAQALRTRFVRRLPIAFGWLVKRPLPDDLVDSFLRPSRTTRAVRRDLTAVLRGVDARHTLAAAERLRDFDRPVLLAWSRDDRLFPIELAHRLAERLPHARIAPIDDAYTFSPIDQPETTASLVTEFIEETRIAAQHSP